MFRRTKNHLMHWVAILSIAMASIAPTISQAISIADHGQGFSVEVCTVMGAKMVTVADDVTGNTNQSNQTCPYCLAHSNCVLPTQTLLSFSTPKILNSYPELFYKSPKPLTAWITPPNQAPPPLA